MSTETTGEAIVGDTPNLPTEGEALAQTMAQTAEALEPTIAEDEVLPEDFGTDEDLAPGFKPIIAINDPKTGWDYAAWGVAILAVAAFIGLLLDLQRRTEMAHGDLAGLLRDPQCV